MTNPASIADTLHNTHTDLSLDSSLDHHSESTLDNNSDNHLNNNDDLNYATLTEALEQTVFENFDDGLYIGMMSGTSLDGMDAVLCQFSASVDSDVNENGNTEDNVTAPMQLLATYSQDFPPRLREVLLALCQPNGTSR